MSAFFVGHDHIDALLSAALAIEIYAYLPDETPDQRRPAVQFKPADWTAIGRALLEENRKSLESRYPNDWLDLIDEGVTNYAFVPVADFERYAVTPEQAAADAIRLADCYDYQSCEHDGWETSWSRGFTLRLVFEAAKKLAKTRAESVPCWGFSRERALAARDAGRAPGRA